MVKAYTSLLSTGKGFWEELQGEAELVWNFSAKFGELDQEKKAGGSELDELMN